MFLTLRGKPRGGGAAGVTTRTHAAAPAAVPPAFACRAEPPLKQILRSAEAHDGIVRRRPCSGRGQEESDPVQTVVEPRVKKRLPCTLGHADRHQTGLILNLSQGGLFVQTNMPAEPGSLIDIGFRDPSGEADIDLHGAVIWRRRVSSRMTGRTESGMGVRLLGGTPAYAELLTAFLRRAEPELIREAAKAAPEVSNAVEQSREGSEYIVRLALEGSPRTKRLVIISQCPGSARVEALERVGEGWMILDLRKR